MTNEARTVEYDRYNLLIVSDLHLSEGRDQGSKKFSRNEDFFFDEEFARFLAYYQRDPLGSGVKWHLIINGDFLDLLQVVTVKGAAPTLHRDPRRPGYGLACGEQETIFKLGRIAEGHWQFFEALASFVDAGNLLTVIKGNHDVEFHYRGVQEAFVAELQVARKRALGWSPDRGPAPQDSPSLAAHVLFSGWFYFEPGLVWVEHGNRYEQANSFKYWLAPLLPDNPKAPTGRTDEIDLPLGSFFVRYLFNRIERVEPFADNIKPASKFIGWLLRHHLVTALKFAIGDGRYMLGKVRRAWKYVPEAAYAERRKDHIAARARLAQAWSIPPDDLETLDKLSAKSVLSEPSGWRVRVMRQLVLWRLALLLAGLLTAVVAAAAVLAVGRIVAPGLPELVRAVLRTTLPGWAKEVAAWPLLAVVVVGLVILAVWLGRDEEQPGPSYLVERAGQIAELLGVQYVVMGHTHDAELYAIGRQVDREREYFNTGTWTKVFSEEERLIREEVEFIYVQGVRRSDGLQMKLLEWDDGAGCPRLLKLFRDE